MAQLRTIHSQENRLFQVDTPLGKDILFVDTFTGQESLSAPFCFDLRLFSPKADLELKSLMGQPVTVTLKAQGGDRYFHGHVTSFAHTGVVEGVAYYQMRLGPWTEFLRRRLNCRVFQEKKVEDILRMVFDDYKHLANYELQASSRKALTLCMQYHESDFAFVSRLMEEIGWLYHFAFHQDRHVLVVSEDSRNLHPDPLQPDVEFNDSPGSEAEDAIHRMEAVRTLVANKVRLKTFDFKNPTLPLEAYVNTQRQMGSLPEMEVYEYPGAYAFPDHSAGDDQAQVQMEALDAESMNFQGNGTVRSLACGQSFTLENHYAYQGDNAHFIATWIQHKGANNYFDEQAREIYGNEFTCMRKSVRFRPPRSTPRPIMPGPQTAIVVGPQGEEIYCDKYGRVRAKFHWDRSAGASDQSMCWLRVAMPWAGSNFGFITLPRVGQEVLVEFLEGDPDRPIITGSVYNEHQMPPWELPNQKTQSGILTRSSPQGTHANANALRFEDRKGAEEVWLHAEKDQRLEVEQDESHSVGHDRTKKVGNDETSAIGHDRTESVGQNETISIGKDRTETVGQDQAETVGRDLKETVQHNLSLSVGMDQTLQVGGKSQVTVGGDSSESVSGGRTESTGKDVTLAISGSSSLRVGSNVTESIGSDQSVQVSKTYTISAGDELSITVGAASFVMKSDGTITLNGNDLTLKASGQIGIQAASAVAVKGGTINLN